MSRDPFQPSIWLGCHMFAEDFRREPPTWEPLDCGLFLCGSSFTRQRSMRKRQPAAYTSWPCFTLDTGCQSISLSVRTGNHFSSFCFLTTYLCESYFSIVTVKKGANWQQLWKLLCVSAHYTTTWSHYMTEANSSVLLWEIFFCYVFLTFGKVVFRNLWCF